MHAVLLVHIVGGALGLGAGYVALAAMKGARVHRRAGTLFVAGMLGLTLSGALIAALTRVESSVIAGLATAYLVVTGFTAIRPRTVVMRRLEASAMVVGLAVGAVGVTAGAHILVTGVTRDGVPAFAYFILSLPALLGGVSDIRVVRGNGLEGGARLARHLWRMCYALLIAAMSFFFGQTQVIPAPLRHPALLAAPVLVVLVALLYWLWRVRFRRWLPAPRGQRVAGRAVLIDGGQP